MAINLTREDLIRQFRADNPDLNFWTDDDVLDGYVSQLGSKAEEIPVLAEHAQRRRMENTNLGEETWNAVKAGVDQFQGKLYDTAALAGDALGSDRLKQWGDEGRDRNEVEASEYTPAVRAFEQVRTPKDFAYWLSNIVGTNAPQMAGTMVAAGAAALAAPEATLGAGATGLAGLGVRGLAALGLGAGEEAAAGLSAKALAALGGSSLAGFSQMQNYGDLVKQGGENVIPIAVANGLIGSALESITPAGIISRALGHEVKKEAAEGVVRSLIQRYVPAPVVNVALHAAKDGSKEMLTEMLQEATSIGAEMLSNRNNKDFVMDDDQVRTRLLNSGVAGFFLGGGAAGIEAATHSDHHTPASDPKLAKNLADQITRPDTPLSPEIPAVPAAPAAPLPETTATSEPTKTAVPGQSEGVPLATFDQQNVLVSELGMTPTLAATMPAEEATDLILQHRAEQAKAEEAAALAQQKAADLARQQAEDARQQQAAAEEEIRAEQAAAAADEARRQQIASDQAGRLMGQGTLADLRSEAALARSHDAAWTSGARRMAGNNKRTSRALNVSEVETAPVAPNTLAEKPVATGPSQAATIDPHNLPRLTAVPSPATSAEPSIRPAEAAVPPAAAPAPAPTPVPTPTPAPAPAPVPATHGLTSLENHPMVRFVDADSTVSPKAATRAPAGFERWLVFQNPDGEYELRKANSRGTVAVRENMGATLKTITAALKGLASETTVLRTLKEGVADTPRKRAIIEEAQRQGYPVGDTEARGVSPKTLLDSGYGYVGAVEMPAGTQMSNLIKMNKAQYDAAFAASQKLGQDAGVAKVGRKMAVSGSRVSGKVVETLATQLRAMSPDQLSALLATDPKIEDGKAQQADRNARWQSVFETALQQADPEARAAYAKLKLSTQTQTAVTAFTEALKQTGKAAEATAPAARAPVVTSPTSPAVTATPSTVQSPVVPPAPAAPRVEPSVQIVPPQVSLLPSDKVIENFVMSVGLDRMSKLNKVTTDQVLKGLVALAGNPKAQAQVQAAIASMDATQREGLRHAFVERAQLIAKLNHKSLLAAEDAAPTGDLVDDRGEHAKAVEATDADGHDVVMRQQPSDYLAEDKDVTRNFDAVMREASARGANVVLSEARSELKSGGAYSPSNRTVMLAMRNVSHPSVQDFITLVHEVVHDTLETQPEWVQTAIHDAFERLNVGETAFYKNPLADTRVSSGENVAGLPRDEYMMERAVEHATLRGLDANYARNIFATIWRTVKDYVLRAAMYMQGKLVGPENVSGNLAKAYVENVASRVLAGDQARLNGFLGQFGYTPTLGDIQKYLPTGKWNVLKLRLDPKTGTVLHETTGELSEVAARHNVRGAELAMQEHMAQNGIISSFQANREIREIFNGENPFLRVPPQDPVESFQAGIRNATVNAETTVAVANHWDGVISAIHDQLKKLYPEVPPETTLRQRREGKAVADPLTRERLMSILRESDPTHVAETAASELAAVLSNQTGKEVDLQTLGLDMGKKIESLPETVRGVADNMVLDQATRMSSKVSRRLSQVREALAKSKADTETVRSRIVEITNNLTDFKTTERETSTLISSYLQEFADALKDKARLAGNEVKGAQAVLDRLAETADSRAIVNDAGKLRGDLKAVQKIIDNVNVPDLPLLSMFKELFSLESAYEFDLGDASPKAIRAAILEHVQANPDSSLSNLVEIGEGPDSSAKGTALLSAVISFAKQQAVMTDALRLQFSKASDRYEQMVAVRDALKETNPAKLEELRDAAAQNRKRPGQRLIQSLLNERDRLIREQRTAANMEQEAEVLRRVLPTFEDAARRSFARTGAMPYWAPIPGSSILNPASPTATSEEVMQRPATLNVSRDEFIKSEQMQEILRNQRAWMDAREADPNFVADAAYNQMKYQHDMLARFAIDHLVQMVDGVGRGALLHGPGEMATRTGTPAGKVLGRLLQAVETWKRAQKSEDLRFGKDWENAAETFYKSANVQAEWAHDAMYDFAMDFMNSERALDEAGTFESLRKVFAERGGVAGEIVRNDASWKAFTKWIQVSEKINQREVERSLAVGNRVRDEDLKLFDPVTKTESAALRAPIKQGVYTTGGRHLTSRVVSILHGMESRNVLRGDGEANPLSNLNLRLAQNPEGVRTAWMNLIKDQDFRTHIVDPLILNLKPTLPSPARADGIKVPLAPAIAHEAWANAGGDILKFAEQVYQRLGQSGKSADLQAYQASLLNFLGKRLEMLYNKIDETQNTKGLNKSGVAHVAMDARGANDFPAEWMTYPTYSREDLNHQSHVIAINGYLGRNLEVLDGLSSRIEADLREKSKALADATEGMRKDMKRRDPKGYAEAEAALKLYNNYKGGYFADTVRSILDPERGATGDFGPLMELYQLSIVGMLSGMRTSLRDLSSLTRPFQMEKSVSGETSKAVASNTVYAARNALAAVFNAITGSDILKNNPYIKLIESAGLGDPARFQTWREQFAGTRGKADSLDASAAGKVTKVLRMLRNASSMGRFGFNYGASGPALRVNPFPFFTQLQLTAGMETYMHRVAELGAAAGEFYKNNPDKLGQQLTAKDLGYSDATGFATLKDHLAFNGVSLENIGERISKLSDPKLEDILDTNTVRGIGSFIMSNQLIESSPNDRPTWTQTSKLGRVSSMLTGWSLANTAQVFDVMRDPARRRDVKSVLNGVKVMGLGMLPAAIAVSLLVDWYDEELTKKKSNQTPLSQDFLGSALERSANLGTFGLAGELAVGVLGNRDGAGTRALSVDQRIVWVNAIQQLATSMQTLNQVGWSNVNYANFWRPVMGATGVGGILQNIQLYNGLFGSGDIPLLRDEADVTARINMNNYLRVAGREIGLEVRKSGSTGSATANPATPWITNMVLAALSNDNEGFRDAFKGAIEAAKDMPAAGNDPRAYVIKTFAGRNPLKQVFAVSPSKSEVALMMRALPDEGQAAVTQGLRDFNRFSMAIGAPVFTGSEGMDAKTLLRAQARAVGLGSDEATLANIRAARAARFTASDE